MVSWNTFSAGCVVGSLSPCCFDVSGGEPFVSSPLTSDVACFSLDVSPFGVGVSSSVSAVVHSQLMPFKW